MLTLFPFYAFGSLASAPFSDQSMKYIFLMGIGFIILLGIFIAVLIYLLRKLKNIR
jgi:hypothetical protein